VIKIIANFIREWLKDIVVLFVIISLVELTIPKGNMKRYVDFIIGIVIVFTVISPFTKMFNFDINLDKEIEAFSKNIVTKEGVIEKQNKQIEEIFKNNLAKDIKKLVSENTDYKVTKPDEQNLLLIQNINIILDTEDTEDTENKSNEKEIRIEKVHIGNKAIPVSSENNDFVELKELILKYVQIDEKKLIISFEDKGDKYGGNN
jgi:stage III sporulation protein AF